MAKYKYVFRGWEDWNIELPDVENEFRDGDEFLCVVEYYGDDSKYKMLLPYWKHLGFQPPDIDDVENLLWTNIPKTPFEIESK